MYREMTIDPMAAQFASQSKHRPRLITKLSSNLNRPINLEQKIISWL